MTLQKKKKWKKKIIRVILKTQEDKRCKLGSELHDNVGQILATQLFLGMAVKAEPDKEQKYLAETRKYLELAN